MAISTGDTRYEKWYQRFSSATSQSVSPAMTRLMEAPDGLMLARVRFAFTEMVRIEGETRERLCVLGLNSTLLVGQYLNFARQLWKLTSRFSGELANCQGQIILDRWVAAGLIQSVLEDIRSTVFGLRAPAGP